MTYTLEFERRHCDSKYMYGIKTWAEVVDILKNKVPRNTFYISIYKFSSNNGKLGALGVDMSNMFAVITCGTDKVLWDRTYLYKKEKQ